MAVAGSPRRVFGETLRLARLGTREAQYQVGLMYANGVGVAKDLQQAVEWVRQAAQRGLPAAQYLLATRYANGIAVEQDDRAALWWCLNAAEQGHLKAQYKLGLMMAAAHPLAARRALRTAAEQGLAEAQWALGQALAQSASETGDWDEVEVWYRRAAEQGLAAAQCGLGEMLARRTAGGAEEAALWLRRAAQQDFPKAQLALEFLHPRGAMPTRRTRRSPAERRQTGGRWLQAAESADADGRYCIGLMYDLGLGVAPDADIARTQYQAAARLGHARAQAALAALLEPEEPQQARHWYEQACAAGDADARHALARLLLQEHGQEPRLRALGLLQQAAQDAHHGARLALADLLASEGAGLQAGLLQQAAEGGLAEARHRWASCLWEGRGVARDRQQALHWWEEAARAGHAQAASELGAALLGAGRAAEALPWLQAAAEAGEAKAQWNLGGLHAAGSAGLKPDLAPAFDCCHKAAEQGFAPAQATLGVLYERIGRHAQALHWLERAAKAGDPEAQLNLGLMHRAGKGVAKNLEAAFHWFCEAAEQGVPGAQARLGVAYGAGEGVAADPIEAHKWLWIARHRGDALAGPNLEYSASQLSPAQIREAVRRGEAWLRGR